MFWQESKKVCLVACSRNKLVLNVKKIAVECYGKREGGHKLRNNEQKIGRRVILLLCFCGLKIWDVGCGGGRGVIPYSNGMLWLTSYKRAYS